MSCCSEGHILRHLPEESSVMAIFNRGEASDLVSKFFETTPKDHIEDQLESLSSNQCRFRKAREFVHSLSQYFGKWMQYDFPF